MTCRFIVSLLLLAVARLTAADAAPSPREYDVLRRFPAPLLARLQASDRPDAKGLTGSNRQAGQWVEAGPQRGSCRGVIWGVVRDDLPAADDAWRGIEVAFAHQRADGGFEAATRPNGQSARETAAAVETAYFFLQEYGRAVLVIRESPHAAHFAARIAAVEPKLRRATEFLLNGYDTIIPSSGHAVNRVIIAAKAFGTCGRVLDDARLVAAARRLIEFALTRRDEAGVFLEKGGRDSSYNVVSILFGQVLALHVSVPDFDAALPAAVKWELGRIGPDGAIDVTGNTRTGVGKEASWFGEPKKVNQNEIVQALMLYGLVHHDQAAIDAANRVWGRMSAGG